MSIKALALLLVLAAGPLGAFADSFRAPLSWPGPGVSAPITRVFMALAAPVPFLGSLCGAAYFMGRIGWDARFQGALMMCAGITACWASALGWYVVLAS